jgi:hypothetical protein
MIEAIQAVKGNNAAANLYAPLPAVSPNGANADGSTNPSQSTRTKPPQTTNDSTTATAPTKPLATPKPVHDTVALSETAKAKLLQDQGLSAAEIADELGITTSTVLSDLAIVNTVSTTASSTAPAATISAITTPTATVSKVA